MAFLNKQVFNKKERHGITAAQSREHQRAWGQRGWDMALEKGNYDLARQHLNYEIAKGGKIQQIDTSKSMPQRMAEMLAERGIKDPNIGRKNPNVRTVVDFVFSGSPEQMHKLAFGDQKVTLKPGNNIENLDVHYTPEFEQWTKDIYNFVAGHWGEENIIGFYVHGDESTPHIHATIVPVKNGKIDYKGVFVGDIDDKIELSRRTSQLHDELAQLNAKYGLDRGSSLTGKKSKTMQTMEWRRKVEDMGREKELELAEMDRQLSDARHELKLAQTRVKGLTTMVANKEEEKKRLEAELKELERKLRNGEGDRDALQRDIEAQQKAIADATASLAEKQSKLEQAKTELLAAEESMKAMESAQHELRVSVDSLSRSLRTQSGIFIKEQMLNKIITEFKQIRAELPPEKMAAFDDSYLEYLADHANEMLHCCVLLFAGLVADATTFAEGHGGGGGGSDLKWGRDEDEDDRRWAQRCVVRANQMMRPASRGRRR